MKPPQHTKLPQMRVTNTMKGAACVCGAFLIQFSLGTIYTFGNMSPYISSYLRLKTDNVWVTTGDTVWILAGTYFSFGSFMAFGGLIQKKIGSRLTSLLGCWTMSLGVTMTYFTIQKSLLLVILTYGIGFGVGISISYSVSLTAALQWFPRQRGTISGIVVGGFGLGSFLFSLVETKYINPYNLPPRYSNITLNFSHYIDPLSNRSTFSNVYQQNATGGRERYFYDEVILSNIPRCFIIIGVTYAVIQLIGVILLMDFDSSNKNSDKQLNTSGVDQQETKDILLKKFVDINKVKDINKSLKTYSAEIKPKSKEYTVLRAVRNKMFWLLWSTFFFNGIVIVTISAVYKSFGQQFISDDQYFAILGAVGGICNCIGRVIWGRLNDRFTYRIVMTALTVLMAVSMSTFYFCSFISDMLTAKIIYFIWGCMLFVALSGSFAILPVATAQCFGTLNLATIYGLIFTGPAWASILGAIVSSFFFKVIQFRGQFIMATIAAIISLILTQFFRPLQYDDNISEDVMNQEV